MDHRVERISEALREELSELIGYEMSDPRVSAAIITDVHISPDKRHARVRVGVPSGGKSAEVLNALDHARNFLRRELGKRLEMYRIPELHFEADTLAETGTRMEHLLKRIRKGRPRDAGTSVESARAENGGIAHSARPITTAPNADEPRKSALELDPHPESAALFDSSSPSQPAAPAQSPTGTASFEPGAPADVLNGAGSYPARQSTLPPVESGPDVGQPTNSLGPEKKAVQ